LRRSEVGEELRRELAGEIPRADVLVGGRYDEDSHGKVVGGELLGEEISAADAGGVVISDDGYVARTDAADVLAECRGAGLTGASANDGWLVVVSCWLLVEEGEERGGVAGAFDDDEFRRSRSEV